jgi:hypothetical protein
VRIVLEWADVTLRGRDLGALAAEEALRYEARGWEKLPIVVG